MGARRPAPDAPGVRRQASGVRHPTSGIRPEKLNEVLKALFTAEVHGLTISRAQGHGGETEAVETDRGTTVKMELVEKVRIDIGVSESFVEPTIDVLTRAARTGEVGDGKIFVTPVERVVRIRTPRC